MKNKIIIALLCTLLFVFYFGKDEVQAQSPIRVWPPTDMPTEIDVYVDRYCEERYLPDDCPKIEQNIPFENYIVGVLEQEVGPCEVAIWDDEVLRAQAIAARSFAWAGWMTWTKEITIYTGITDIAQGYYPNKNPSVQPRYSAIVTSTSGQYLSSDSSLYPHSVLEALYKTDNPTWTIEPSPTIPTYLRSVYDPISARYGRSMGPGMGQHAMQRWMAGYWDSTMIDPTPYGIQWEHHWQILTHFYSYSHIRDYYDSDRVLTPPHRWNALLITPTVPTMIAGASYPFTLTIQNTGSYSWTAGDYAIGYEWRDATGAVLAAGSPVSLTAEVLPGAPLTLTLPVTAPVVTTRGTYTLAWDLRGADGAWFQAQEPPWFPQDVAVAVQPRCAYTLPLTPTLGTGEYPDVAYDGGRVEYLVVWGADDAVRGRIVRSTGEATNISFTLPASLYLDYGWGVRAAYTPAAARYVLVWRDARTAYHHLHGQVIASGGQVAADFALPSAPNRHQGQPAIACSTTVSECVVVWQEGLETLYARPLRFIATAAITWGAKITIAQHGAPAYAALAYYTPSQHYVVIWKTRTRLEWYLYSISGLGLQVDDTEIITHTLNIPTLVAHASVRPAVSCGAANCLIVWRDEAERLGGQLVWDDDTLANTATVPIAATGRYPTLVYHQSGDKYWLAWESNGAIYGQELHRDGGRWCLNTLLARTPGINLEWVRAAAGDTADEYLVVWQEAGEIRGTLYRGPSCCEQVCLPAIFKGYGYD